MSENLVYIMERNSTKEIFVCDQYINHQYGDQLAKSMGAKLIGVRDMNCEPIRLNTPYQLMLARLCGPNNRLHYRQQIFPIFMKNDFGESHDYREGSFLLPVLLPTMATNVYAVAELCLEDCYQVDFQRLIKDQPVEFVLEDGSVYLMANGKRLTQLASID